MDASLERTKSKKGVFSKLFSSPGKEAGTQQPIAGQVYGGGQVDLSSRQCSVACVTCMLQLQLK